MYEARVAEVWPENMRWRDVDPARHPFPWDDAEQARVKAMITARRAGGPGTVVPGTRAQQPDDILWVCELFAERYGPWTAGWEWSVEDSGPVDHPWPDTTSDAPELLGDWAVGCLLRWRAWLEDRAEDFVRLAPPHGSGRDDRRGHIERAVARLVTAVVERTGCEEVWITLLVTTLRWYFEACGFGPEEADAAAETAMSGRFESWVRPDEQVVRDYAESLATEVTGGGADSER